MASSKIKGITIEIDGDTTKLGNALDASEKSSKSLQSELKGINTLLKVDPSNVELLTQKQQVLTAAIGSTKEKLDTLKAAQSQVQAQFERGEITIEQYRDFQREIIYTQQRLENLEEQQKKFGTVAKQQMEAASTKVKEFGSKVEEAGGKLSGLSTAAGAALGAAGLAASSLEGATNKYIATTGKSVEETERYKNVLQNIHDNNYGEDYADIADKMQRVSTIMGNLPDEELQNIVEKTYSLQDAYDMDFQETLRGVNGLMQNMGLTSEQAFDLMTKGAQNGLNVSDELGDNIAEYSQLWGQAGFSAEEMFTMLDNGLNNGAYNLDKVNDLVKEMGISLVDGRIEENLGSFSTGTQNLFKEWQNGGATQAEVVKSLIGDLAGMEDQQEALTLASTVWSALGEDNAMAIITSLNDVNDTFVDTTGTADEFNNTLYSGSGAEMETAMKKIKSAFAEIGEVLLPIISKIAEKLADWADKFSNLNPTIQTIIVVITGLVAAIAPILIVIGKVISSVGTIMGVIAKLMPIITAIGSFITGTIIPAIGAVVTAIGWPVIAIMAVIGVIVLLWNKCEWFRDGVKAIWEAIKKGFQAAVDWLSGVFSKIGDFFVGVWEKIQEVWAIVSGFFITIAQWYFDNVISPILNFFKKLWDGIVAIFTPIVDWFTELFSSVWKSIESILNVIVGLFKGTWELIKAVWGIVAKWFNDSVITPIKNFFTPIVQWFKDIFSKAVEGIKIVFGVISQWFRDRWTDITNIFNVVGTWFKDTFNKAVSNIKAVFTPVGQFFTGIWNGIKNAFGNVADWFKNIFTNAWTNVKNVFSTGGKIFDGIKDGISSTFKTVVNGLIGGINKVISVPFNAINGLLNKIRAVSVVGIEPFKGFIKYNALSVPQIPKLDVGTNKIKKEGLAYLHKDEAVVTEKYNPAIHDDVMKDSIMDALTNFTNTKVQNSNSQNGIGELTRLIKQYMPLIVDNMGKDIVLDGKTLVGKIAPAMDKQLGVITNNKNRGY